MGNRNHRSPGTGSLTQRSDGAWIARVTDPATRKRRKRVVAQGVREDGRPETPAAHRGRAERVLADLRAEVEAGRSKFVSSVTVADYADAWLENRTELKPSTREHYERILRLYVVPVLGKMPLHKVTGADVDGLDHALIERGLGFGTRRHARVTLGLVLKDARYERIVTDLATSDARPVRPDPPDRPKSARIKAIDAADLNRFLSAADEPRIQCLFAVMGTLGLRIGEALGLAWDMVDLEARVLRVERNLVELKSGPDLGTPKTQDRSVGSLPLPPLLVTSLRRWKTAQASERLAARAWDESFGVDFVFSDEAGRPLSRGRVEAALTRSAAKAGVGRISPHSLRHSAGSIALGAGVPITEVSRMLGHKSPAITLQVYAHDLTDGTRAATAIADAVGAWAVSGSE